MAGQRLVFGDEQKMQLVSLRARKEVVKSELMMGTEYFGHTN